jgi:hypothetical protein
MLKTKNMYNYNEIEIMLSCGTTLVFANTFKSLMYIKMSLIN